MSLLKNLWYVAANSTDLSDTPTGVRMLGQDFVLFRDEQGAAHCLSDICIHRGASLCRGKRVNGTVQCPYHGWRYDGSGACVEIPALGPDKTPPKRARVDSYPVQEKWGWVWVFLGDLPENERPPLPDYFPEFEDPDSPYKFLRGTFEFDASWTRVVENGLDPAHPFFVHTAFGNPENPIVEDYPIEKREYGAYSTRAFMPVQKTGRWREDITDERPDVRTDLEVHMSGPSIRIQMHLKPPMNQIIVSAYTPIDAHRTLSWWIQGRNFAMDDKFDEDSRSRVLQVFQEDADVINYIKPIVVPPKLADELSIGADAHGVAFRKMVKEYEARGWGIDTQALAADDRAHVIPSPERAKDPNNWVLDPVPFKAPKPLGVEEEAG